MDNQDRRLHLIQEWLETALTRNKKHLLVVCEDINIPSSVIVQSINTGIEGIVLTNYLRQDDTPIVVKGDIVVTHKENNEADGRPSK